MGITKALMEKVAVAESRNIPVGGTIVCLTRYGNVMASRGSVIPLFIDQLKSGNSLTITDPSMTRFLMSLEEAVDLVLFAFMNGMQGDLFVQKSPASTIEDLGKALSELFNVDYKPNIIGTRHGEKLYETLCTREEMSKAIDLVDFYKIPADNRDLNYGKYFEEGDVKASSMREDYNSHNTRRLTVEEIKDKILSLSYIQKEISSFISYGK
jgi:UDP-glucose 4-epimerase